MSTVNSPATIPTNSLPTPARIPPLEQGDSLSRDEFERRYFAMPNCKKAELIEGIVYMPSPVSYSNHAEPHSDINYWLCHYRVHTPGVRAGDNSTVRLDLTNEPQPDVLLFIDPQCGGQVKINNGYLEGSPELVAEVSASSVSIDMHAKRRVYLRNGVKEYIVWRVQDTALDWFVLRNTEYANLLPDAAGILRSETFPGLWLHVAALLAGNLAEVLKTLQAGLNDESHRQFVEQLATRHIHRIT